MRSSVGGGDLAPGTRVRLKADPGRSGITTGRWRERGERKFCQVTFSDSSTGFFLPSQLEIAQHEAEDPLELLRFGKFGRARDLRGSITFIRLTGRLANLIYSMETTNTDFYPYQFRPVLNFLESPSNGLLIADEVGLGKTIEAGLIWTEIRSRFDARRFMVLCPAMLREKWYLELRRRFGIEGEIANATETLKRLKEFQNGERLDMALICSIQGLRPRRGWDDEVSERKDGVSALARFLQDNEYSEPLLDLLVVDEAHYMRNPESMTAKLGAMLRKVSSHVVLLSATPIHLRSADLFHLLNLVDENTFEHESAFDEILEANAPLMRIKTQLLTSVLKQGEFAESLAEAVQHPLLSGSRQLAELLNDPPSDEDLAVNETRSALANRLEEINLLARAVTRTRKRDVKEWKVVREVTPEVIPLSPPEEAFYKNVTALVRDFCKRRQKHEGFLLVTPQRQMSSSMPAALQEWQRRATESAERDSVLYEDIGVDDAEDSGSQPLVEEITRRAYDLGDLNELLANDSKYTRLERILKGFFQQFPKEKIVLFAYFRPTLRYLKDRLTTAGIPCALLVGGMEVNKNDVLDAFRESETTRILLSSEVASEGVDLQFCRVVINYDLPWNPMKIEQRIGRLDRIGQRAEKIAVWSLFYADTIDERIYTRLYERLKIFEHALGGLEAILGEEIRDLTLDLLRGDLTPHQEAERIEQTAQAIVNVRVEEETLEQEAGNLIAHGDYILNQVKAVRELNRRISGEDLWLYVRDFLNDRFHGCDLVQVNTDELLFDIRLSAEARFKLEDFIVANKLHGKSRLSVASATPIRCLFVNKVQDPSQRGFEFINQWHPLVRFVSKQTSIESSAYYPTVSVSLNRTAVPSLKSGEYEFTVNRWSVQGLRSIERLCFVVAPISRHCEFLGEDDAERLVVQAARLGIDWLAARNKVDLELAVSVATACLDENDRLYGEFVRQISNENEDRADLQERSLKRHHERQVEVKRRTLDNLKSKEQLRLIPAVQGQLKKLDEKTEQKLHEISERRRLSHHNAEVCLGVIEVTD